MALRLRNIGAQSSIWWQEVSGYPQETDEIHKNVRRF